MHKKIKFFKNELLNMMKLTQFIKKFNGSFGPPYNWHGTLNFCHVNDTGPVRLRHLCLKSLAGRDHLWR